MKTYIIFILCIICFFTAIVSGTKGENLKTNLIPTFLLSDEEFTWENYSYEEALSFYQSFDGNKFTPEQVKLIYDKCKEHKLSLIVFSAKLEGESSVVTNSVQKDYEWRMNRAMGYGCYIKKKNPDGTFYYPFGGFEKQVAYSTRSIRGYLTDFRKGKSHNLMHEKKFKVYPDNAATYALYKYCPYYGEYLNFGYKNVGNRLFMNIYRGFKKRWIRVNGEM